MSSPTPGSTTPKSGQTNTSWMRPLIPKARPGVTTILRGGHDANLSCYLKSLVDALGDTSFVARSLACGLVSHSREEALFTNVLERGVLGSSKPPIHLADPK